MAARARLALAMVVAAVAAAVLTAVAYRTLAPPAAPAGVGGPFTLQATDGRTVTDRDFRGRPMLIYFGYTHCPDACPAALSQMTAALDRLGPAKDRVAALFITIDPERDTLDVLKSYVAPFDGAVLGLSGSAEQLAAAEKAYRVYAAKDPPGPDGAYAMAHSSVIYLMGPDGRFLAAFSDQTSAEQIAERLKTVVN